MPIFKKVWHPYTAWEEYHAGMWRKVYGHERTRFLQASIAFTGDPELYGKWMMSVIEAWPISCEHNLTDYGINKCGKYIFEVESDRDEDVFIRFVSRDYDWVAQDRHDKSITVEEVTASLAQRSLF
jgi:hypothetical protein